MPPAALTPEARETIGLASPEGIARAFQSVRENLKSQNWLLSSNPYGADCIDRLKHDVSSRTVEVSDLAQYIAASVPLHCTDGWTFLAHSINCYCGGSPGQAAHFAYYAELRAAMSILASRGIGVFNRQHFVVNDRGKAEQTPIPRTDGTHKFSWAALDDWSNSHQAGEAVLDLLDFAGSSAKSWFRPLSQSSSATSLGGSWLKKWGLDLQAMDTDHNVRNFASYRPTDFTAWVADARECSQFIRSLWTLFEPSDRRFSTLDKHLVRSLVRKTILSSTGKRRPIPLKRELRQIEELISGAQIDDGQRQISRDFLTEPGEDPSILLLAEAPGEPSDCDIHQRIISRAALLLRLASGFTAQLMEGAGLSATDVAFWSDKWAVSRSFWSPGNTPDDVIDLWADIQSSIEDEHAWIERQSTSHISMHTWRSGREDTIKTLAEFDRIAVWHVA